MKLYQRLLKLVTAAPISNEVRQKRLLRGLGKKASLLMKGLILKESQLRSMGFVLNNRRGICLCYEGTSLGMFFIEQGFDTWMLDGIHPSQLDDSASSAYYSVRHSNIRSPLSVPSILRFLHKNKDNFRTILDGNPNIPEFSSEGAL